MKEKIKGIDLTDIVDIFLFGSAVKGKEFPKDIDLCVIFRDKIIERVIKDIENRLKNFNVHLSFLTIDNLFKNPHSLIKTLLVEGVSILTNKPFIQNFGFLSYVLYSYDLSKMNSSEKVRFVYLLKGRKEKGIIKKFNGEWITDGCFVIPVIRDNEVLTIFKKWNIRYLRREVLIH